MGIMMMEIMTLQRSSYNKNIVVIVMTGKQEDDVNGDVSDKYYVVDVSL